MSHPTLCQVFFSYAEITMLVITDSFVKIEVYKPLTSDSQRGTWPSSHWGDCHTPLIVLSDLDSLQPTMTVNTKKAPHVNNAERWLSLAQALKFIMWIQTVEDIFTLFLPLASTLCSPHYFLLPWFRPWPHDLAASMFWMQPRESREWRERLLWLAGWEFTCQNEHLFVRERWNNPTS